MRAWMAVAAAVGVVAASAACGDKNHKPADDTVACLTAIQDSRGFGAKLGTSIDAARGAVQGNATSHYQAMADAKSYATDWLVKIKDLLGKDISPDLRQTLTESQTTIEEIQSTLGDATANPPDATGKLAGIDGNINRVCKGKY
ncbi:MAG TPA: hypothetical protein VL738_38545 [Dactylosporangium sp.]|jgi:hypothetical protein|nr:hypothetical protein [Dactylosporangium sp.]